VSRYGSVETLAPDHDLSAFECGSAAQTAWLRRHGLQAHRSDTARVYVVCVAGTRTVVGYYALASGSVAPAAAPRRVTKGTGRHPVPVVILTRLGVDRTEQGRGLGTGLVRDSLFQVLLISELVGVRALLIHAETPEAATFYRKIDPGFESSPTDPLHLVLLIKDLRLALRDALKARFGGEGLDQALEINDPSGDVATLLAAVSAAREQRNRGR
jgi:hypothetical protein